MRFNVTMMTWCIRRSLRTFAGFELLESFNQKFGSPFNPCTIYFASLDKIFEREGASQWTKSRSVEDQQQHITKEEIMMKSLWPALLKACLWFLDCRIVGMDWSSSSGILLSARSYYVGLSLSSDLLPTQLVVTKPSCTSMVGEESSRIDCAIASPTIEVLHLPRNL